MNYTAKFRRFPGRVINQKQIHCNTCCTRPRSCGFLMRRPRGNMKSFSLLSVSSLVNISVDCNNKAEAAKRSVETFWHPSVLSLPPLPREIRASCYFPTGQIGCITSLIGCFLDSHFRAQADHGSLQLTSSVRPRSRALQKEEERQPANEHVIFHGKAKMEHTNTDVPFYFG